MSKNTFFVSAFIISSLLLVPSVVLANDSSYVSVQVGGAVPNSKLTHETVNAGLLKKSPKNAAVFDITAGTEVFANTYAELELAYADHKLSNNYQDNNSLADLHATSFKTRVKTMTGFANLSYRFKNLNMPIIPYITAGLGISSNKVKNMSIATPSITFLLNSSGKTTTQAAWQIGAGILVPVTKNMAVNLSYKYRDLGKIKTTRTLTSNSGAPVSADHPVLQGRMRTSNILLGVDISF
jgi:opacity protein-like surface antigen